MVIPIVTTIQAGAFLLDVPENIREERSPSVFACNAIVKKRRSAEEGMNSQWSDVLLVFINGKLSSALRARVTDAV
jgi:hypothetical protein